MKRFVIAAAFTLLTVPAFGGETEHTALMLAQLAKDSAPANVSAVVLQQKRLSCEQNAKNFRLQNEAKANYVANCLNRNDALVQYMAYARKAGPIHAARPLQPAI